MPKRFIVQGPRVSRPGSAPVRRANPWGPLFGATIGGGGGAVGEDPGDIVAPSKTFGVQLYNAAGDPSITLPVNSTTGAATLYDAGGSPIVSTPSQGPEVGAFDVFLDAAASPVSLPYVQL